MSVPASPRSRGFIFQDTLGRRWPRLRLVLLIWGVVLAVCVVWFFQVLLVRPELRLPSSVRTLKGQLKTAAQRSTLVTNDPNEMNWQKFYAESPASQERLARIRAQLKKAAKPKGEIRLGLYVDWDPNSFASLEEHAGSLTHLAPEWFSLVDTDSKLEVDADARVASFAGARGLTLLPMVRNLSGNDWQPEAVENLARGTADRRARFINELIAGLQKAKAGGAIIDWQQLDPSFRDDYTDLLDEIAEALHAADMELWFMVSLGEDFKTFDLDGLSGVVDRFVAVLHDENGDADPPGPIASQSWLEGWLKVITGKDAAGQWLYGEPQQWIGLLGAYAYDWNTTTRKTETITFKDAMSRASYAGIDLEEDVVKVEAPSYNGQYDYSEPGGEHTVSFLDAISLYNQLRAVRASKLGGMGLSRLGTEDPQVWDVLEPRWTPKPAALKALGLLKASQTITHVGRGEIVSVEDTRDDGVRAVDVVDPSVDPLGPLRASYFDFPTYPILYHEGAGGLHEVAITFDDGPDPKWTPKILDVLRARGVKAAFFLVGKNCEDHPALVERLVREGHEIGNHTFSHSNLAIMSPDMMRLELNATQRLIESITGRSTTLFRPPYNADSNPTDIAELAPLKLAQEELGYTVVLEKVDPQDWAKPGADVILQRVKELRPEGNIILLHDAGGDRSQTLEALPRIIDYLQARGDRIVPLGELLHIPRDELMPPVSNQPLERIVAGAGFRVWHATVEFFWAAMIFATVLVALRTGLVAWLAHRHHRRLAAVRPEFHPPLSVIIAAYNEEKVIAKTLRSVLETDYPAEFEVLVIDDGSRDRTSEEVQQVAAKDPRVRLLRQPNGGKATALAAGLAQAEHGILVFLDADTLFERGTLGAIVQPLAKPLVGAVSGHARVGNLRTFIARCQALEYICGFNLDRRAYTEWNCITVVPGAVSALRKTAIEVAGGFSHDTLAEDTDLTLSLHRLGYRIEYAPDAIAWTEAPETVATLAKQRFRWAYGTMQCLWKHRDLVFNPRFGALGWFSLPGIWIFQILLVAITPLVDAILLYSLLFGHAGGIWYYFAAFLLMDICLALLACRIEEESLWKAFTVVPMRFVYRPLLSWVIWKSISRAVKGAFVGWGKLERTGAVPSRA